MAAINVTVQGVVCCWTPEAKEKGAIGRHGVCHHSVLTLLSDQVAVRLKAPLKTWRVFFFFYHQSWMLSQLTATAFEPCRERLTCHWWMRPYVVGSSEATVVGVKPPPPPPPLLHLITQPPATSCPPGSCLWSLLCWSLTLVRSCLHLSEK